MSEKLSKLRVNARDLKTCGYNIEQRRSYIKRARNRYLLSFPIAFISSVVATTAMTLPYIFLNSGEKVPEPLLAIEGGISGFIGGIALLSWMEYADKKIDNLHQTAQNQRKILERELCPSEVSGGLDTL